MKKLDIYESGPVVDYPHPMSLFLRSLDGGPPSTPPVIGDSSF